MGRGQEDNNNTRTSRLLDQLGPGGQVGEKKFCGENSFGEKKVFFVKEKKNVDKRGQV